MFFIVEILPFIDSLTLSSRYTLPVCLSFNRWYNIRSLLLQRKASSDKLHYHILPESSFSLYSGKIELCYSLCHFQYGYSSSVIITTELKSSAHSYRHYFSIDAASAFTNAAISGFERTFCRRTGSMFSGTVTFGGAGSWE